MKEGDYVAVYDEDGNRSASNQGPFGPMIGSGVVLESYDIPNTFGRKMYEISINGTSKTFDDAYYIFEVLSAK